MRIFCFNIGMSCNASLKTLIRIADMFSSLQVEKTLIDIKGKRTELNHFLKSQL